MGKKAPAKRRTRAQRLKDDGVLKGGRLAKHDHEAIECLTADEHKQLTRILKKVKKAYPSGKKMNANFV